MIDRTQLLDKLNRATDRALSMAIDNEMPIPIFKNSTMIGKSIIEKNMNGFYNILTLNRDIVYKDISLFDIAVIIAKKYNHGQLSTINRIFDLEDKFLKHHTDMVHYLHCIKGAKKSRDTERLAILEDKFQVSEFLAKTTKDSLLIFKRVR